jgi:GNAT superfamily N-acetyltransferase
MLKWVCEGGFETEMGRNNDAAIAYGGYFPGVLGRIVELHATYYHEHWSFDLSFETQVGKELSEFMIRYREGRDFFLAARLDCRLLGSIAVDSARSAEEGARLRWFIVQPDYQGRGIGRRLLEEAVSFCSRSGVHCVFLWTFRGLDAARFLYERAGFRIAEENTVQQWGGQIREQKFELLLESVDNPSERGNMHG